MTWHEWNLNKVSYACYALGRRYDILGMHEYAIKHTASWENLFPFC